VSTVTYTHRTTGAHTLAAFHKRHLSNSPWLDHLWSLRNQVVWKSYLTSACDPRLLR